MLRAVLLKDFSASVVVFLVALPLCLGIALASDAPLMSGIISGVVGGIVVGLLSGSSLSVSGPAAGLTVIVATQIHEVGSFEKFLAIVVLAGVIQFVLGVLRAGQLVAIFPSAVIHGMLAAIGLIIISKQVPYALGSHHAGHAHIFFKSFTDSSDIISEVFRFMSQFELGAVLITLVSIPLLFLWGHWQKHSKWLFYVPGPLVVVIIGILLNESFQWSFPQAALASSHLVAIPLSANGASWTSALRLPDFAIWTDPRVISFSLVMALVASIETLLSIEATDRIDPRRRISDANQELIAQGLGNMIAGFLGGLPMTSVIVRSSANVYAGAENRWSAVLHGVWLLLAVLLLPHALNLIPLASLAAVLIVVGYKLTPVDSYFRMFREGYNQFVPFAATVMAVVFSDLLTGVGVGFALALIFAVRHGFSKALTFVDQDSGFVIYLNRDVTFLNKIKLKKILAGIPDSSQLQVDATQCEFADHDIVDVIHEFARTAHVRNIKVEVLNLEGKQYHARSRSSALRRRSAET